jgi:hypothetical protein
MKQLRISFLHLLRHLLQSIRKDIRFFFWELNFRLECRKDDVPYWQMKRKLYRANNVLS